MDLAIVAACFVATLSIARIFGVPGPGTWAIALALVVASWRLYHGGSGWVELGLRPPQSWVRAAGWIAVLFAASAGAAFLVIEPLSRAAGWQSLDLSRFAGLPGNATALVGWLLLVWTSAAFAEELVFRGFVLTRLEMAFGDGRGATAMAIIVQAFLFGVAHFYLGARGIATAATVGLIYGLVYTINGRNLLPLIAAHGITDSLSFIALYAGLAPIQRASE